MGISRTPEFQHGASVELQRGQWYLARVRQGVDFAPTAELVMPRPWKTLARGPQGFTLAQVTLYVDDKGVETLGQSIYGYAAQLDIGPAMSEVEVLEWLREFRAARNTN